MGHRSARFAVLKGKKKGRGGYQISEVSKFWKPPGISCGEKIPHREVNQTLWQVGGGGKV